MQVDYLVAASYSGDLYQNHYYTMTAAAISFSLLSLFSLALSRSLSLFSLPLIPIILIPAGSNKFTTAKALGVSKL